MLTRNRSGQQPLARQSARVRASLASFFANFSRSWLVACTFSLPLLFSSNAHATSCSFYQQWPAWEAFKKNLISADGRVIDYSHNAQHSTSEGQAYALFFALVAQDKASFATLLNWTTANLAGNDLSARLPAWQWGQKADKSWGVIDANSASDADLWLAYTLLQAGELWREPRYAALGELLSQRILNEESADLPGLGLSLLPAPQGFKLSDKRWKLNPSYLPVSILRWFDKHGKDKRWSQLFNASIKALKLSSPKGYAPDWFIYDADLGMQIDSEGEEKGRGGYNAIRVYLWAGIADSYEPQRKDLLKLWAPIGKLIEQHGTPAEFIDILSGTPQGFAPPGFSAALLPFLYSSEMHALARQQELRLQAMPAKPDSYYDQVLSLYSQGWLEQRYRFDSKGRLKLPRCGIAEPSGTK